MIYAILIRRNGSWKETTVIIPKISAEGRDSSRHSAEIPSDLLLPITADNSGKTPRLNAGWNVIRDRRTVPAAISGRLRNSDSVNAATTFRTDRSKEGIIVTP